MDLSIIIVSFNTKEFTINCLKSICETVKKIKAEIIVVDNNSSDGSVEALEEFAKKSKEIGLTIIKNAENYGFSKANNIGVLKSKGKYVLFLNSDTVVYEDAINGVVSFMESNEKAGASTCYIELPNGMIDDASHRGFPTPWRAFSHFSGLERVFPKVKIFSGYSFSFLSLNEIHEIDSLAGAFMMVRRTAGEEVGWWDEDFFWYGDDIDFCYRLKESGWKIFFVPDFKILHYKGVSGGIKDVSKHITNATEETRKKAMEARFSAMRVFYNKHYKDKYPSLINWLVLFGIDLKYKIERMRN